MRAHDVGAQGFSKRRFRFFFMVKECETVHSATRPASRVSKQWTTRDPQCLFQFVFRQDGETFEKHVKAPEPRILLGPRPGSGDVLFSSSSSLAMKRAFKM